MSLVPKGRPGIYARIGLYTSLGFILPAAALGGYGLGWLLDRWLGTAPVLAILLALLGAGSGLVEILRILTRAERDGNRDNRSAGTRSQ